MLESNENASTDGGERRSDRDEFTRQVRENVDALTSAVVHTSKATQSISNIVENSLAVLRSVPSRSEFLRYIVGSAFAIVTAVAVLSWVQYTATVESRKIGEQNQEVVWAFCQAQPDLPECTNDGSATAKAAAILANCRIWKNLQEASPRPFSAATDKACKAVGY